MTDPTSTASRSAPLEALLSRLGRMMRAVGARYGVGDDEVDTLVQEVGIRLWRAHPDGEEIGRLPTSYVYRTAMAAAVDLVRKRRREWTRETELTGAVEVAARDGADDALLADDLGAAIERALMAMLETRRTVVRLHLAGYDRDEITTLLGWSGGKVRNLLYRGLEDLRTALGQAGYRWPEDT